MAETWVLVRATRSFMDVRQGDESLMPLDDTVQGWINAGHIIVLSRETLTVKDAGPGEVTLTFEEDSDGPDPAGPGSAEPDDEEREPDEG